MSQFHPTRQAHDWLPGSHRKDLRARHGSKEPHPQLVCPGRADVSLLQVPFEGQMASLHRGFLLIEKDLVQSYLYPRLYVNRDLIDENI